MSGHSKKKRGPGRPPTGIRPTMGVRLYPETEERLDQWIAEQGEDGLGRHEAVRRLLDYARISGPGLNTFMRRGALHCVASEGGRRQFIEPRAGLLLQSPPDCRRQV
jgi:hypothetical protein